MIYGYIRVSTDKQSVLNQRFEIEQFTNRSAIKVDRWVEETISSTVNLNKRKLGHLLKRLKKDDILIASELSRLGRNLLQVMSILHHCMSVGCQVWTIKDNYRLGSDIQSKVLAFAFGLSAEIERTLISQRTKESLARLKSEGRVLGRPKGAKNKISKLATKEIQIQKFIDKGLSKSQIARLLKVDRLTLYRYLDQKKELPDDDYEGSSDDDYIAV